MNHVSTTNTLVLADLQFGRFGIKVENAETEARILTEHLQPGSLAPKLVILPGDITSTGHPDEFEAARKYLDIIINWAQSSCRPKLAGVIFCPGNHDLDVIKSHDVTAKFSNYTSFLQEFYSDYWSEFGSMKLAAAPWFGIDEASSELPDKIPSPKNVNANDLWTIYDFRDDASTFVFSLNSAATITANVEDLDGKLSLDWDPKDITGFVSAKEQLEPLAQSIQRSTSAEEDVSRVAVLHHNIAHARPLPSDQVRAGGQMMIARNYVEIAATFQALDVDVVVHGHQHEPLISRHSVCFASNHAGLEEKTLTIFGAGSAGAVPNELGRGIPNRVHLIGIEARDPTNDQILSFTTFKGAEDSVGRAGTEAFRWTPDSNGTVGYEPLNGFPHGRLSSSIADQISILMAVSFDQALERFVGYLASQLGHRPVGITLYEKDQAGGGNTTRASTFDSRDREYLNRLYEVSETKKIRRYENALVEVGQYRLSGHVSDRSAENIALHQSRLKQYPTLDYLDVAIELREDQQVGIRLFFNAQSEDGPIGVRFLVQIMRRVLVAIYAYWGSSLNTLICDSDGQENNTACFRAVVDDLGAGNSFDTSILDVDRPRNRYAASEIRLFRAKRQIEALIVYSVVYGVIDEHGFTNAGLSEVIAQAKSVLGGSIKRPASRDLDNGGSDFAQEVLDPLLVSFWVPRERNDLSQQEGRSVQDVSLSYCLTRDQITYYDSFAIGDRGRKRRRKTVKDLLAKEMMSYRGIIYDGIAAYVYVSEAPYFTDSAYESPMVGFDALDLAGDFSSSHDSADIEELLQYFEQRIESREELNDLERDVWGTEEQGALVTPIYGRSSIGAVLQIQTQNQILLDQIRRVDFCNALSLLDLDIEDVQL